MHAELIQRALSAAGRSDRADAVTATLVEEFLLTGRTGLDELSPDDIASEALDLITAMDTDPSFAKSFCRALGLELPDWAQ